MHWNCNLLCLNNQCTFKHEWNKKVVISHEIGKAELRTILGIVEDLNNFHTKQNLQATKWANT